MTIKLYNKNKDFDIRLELNCSNIVEVTEGNEKCVLDNYFITVLKKLRHELKSLENVEQFIDFLYQHQIPKVKQQRNYIN